MKKFIPFFIVLGGALFLVMCTEGHHHEPKAQPRPPIVTITPLPGNREPLDPSKRVLTQNQDASTSEEKPVAGASVEAIQPAIESSIQGSFDVDLLLNEALGALSFPLKGINVEHWDQNVFAFSLQSPDKELQASLIVERERIDREGKLLRSYGLRLERSFEKENKYLDGILREDSRLDIQILFDEAWVPQQLLIGVYMPVALGRAKAMGTDLYYGQYVDSAIYTLLLDGVSEPYCHIAGLQNGQPVQPGMFPGTTLPGQLWPSKDLLEAFSQKLHSLVSQVEEK